MKLKSLAVVVVATLSLASFDALACSTSAWIPDGGGSGVNGAASAGEPDDATPIARYSGRCGLKSDATGGFVVDGSPNNEATYRVRFYALSTVTGGSPVIFRALQTGQATPRIEVVSTGTTFTFAQDGGTPVASAAVTPGRWYAIELNWAAGSAMTATIQGAGGAALANVTVPAGSAASRIDSAQVGWVAGAGTGRVTVDAFESRRTTAIGRLCRGDANGDGTRNSGDQIAQRNEFLQISLASGQPDANEDGTVNSGDQIITRNIFLAGQGSCSAFPNL